MGEIRELQAAVFKTAQDHGWWDTADDVNIPSKLALIHSEVSEALEAFRLNKMEPYFLKLDPETGKFKTKTTWDEYLAALDGGASYADYKPMGFGTELADVFIRLMDLAEFLEIDLEGLTLLKAEFNKSRPPRHGGKKV